MKKYHPTTPSRRSMQHVSFKKVLTVSNPFKALTYGSHRKVGRNSAGRITVRHKGGVHKRLYREVDFLYAKKNIPARVESLEYDPNRSGFIARICYRDGEREYILAPRSVSVGTILIVSETAPLEPGNRLPLKKIPVGSFVYNVEVKPYSGAKLVRSAGSYAEVIAHDVGYIHLKM